MKTMTEIVKTHMATARRPATDCLYLATPCGLKGEAVEPDGRFMVTSGRWEGRWVLWTLFRSQVTCLSCKGRLTDQMGWP